MTFAIIENSFSTNSEGTATEIVEMLSRQLIENGGRIVDSNSRANFVVFEDGYDLEVWQKIPNGKGDDLGRSIVHVRWVEACIK